MHRAHPLLLAAGLVALAAAPASASTVDLGVGERDTGRVWEVRYTAAAGERNDVAVATVDHFTVRVSDAGAPISPGAGCRSIDAGTVECSNAGEPYQAGISPYLYTARVLAGDGDDIVRSAGWSGPPLVADGGADNDVLEGSDQKADELDGGGGIDRLAGRGNADDLTDGDATGAVGADLLDGGADRDIVSYAARTAPVTLDLADEAVSGEAGERDVLRDVEGAIGGSGDDSIDADAEANVIQGGPGDDHLDGHGRADQLYGDAGNDVLHGHAGNDALSGGEGADRLRGDDGADVVYAASSADRLSCGGGHDAISQAGDGVAVPRGCETLSYAFDPGTGRLVSDDEGTRVELGPFPISTSRRGLTFAIGCPKPADADGLCAMRARQTVRLRSAASRRTLGVGRLNQARYQRQAATERLRRSPITVTLTRAGRRLLARRGGLPTTVSLKTDDLDTVRWTVRLSTR